MGENGNLIEINRKENELALVTVTRIATLKWVSETQSSTVNFTFCFGCTYVGKFCILMNHITKLSIHVIMDIL